MVLLTRTQNLVFTPKIWSRTQSWNSHLKLFERACWPHCCLVRGEGQALNLMLCCLGGILHRLKPRIHDQRQHQHRDNVNTGCTHICSARCILHIAICYCTPLDRFFPFEQKWEFDLIFFVVFQCECSVWISKIKWRKTFIWWLVHQWKSFSLQKFVALHFYSHKHLWSEIKSAGKM